MNFRNIKEGDTIKFRVKGDKKFSETLYGEVSSVAVHKGRYVFFVNHGGQKYQVREDEIVSR